jgi:hypothetical protein
MALTEADAKELVRTMAIVAKTEAGIRLLQHIMHECGFQSASAMFNQKTGEVVASAMIYNEARRNIWLELRKWIPADRLVLIENPMPDGETWIDQVLKQGAKKNA